MATLNLDEILNYVNPEPRYAGKLKDLGLLEAGDLEAARKQSIFQGLLGAGLGYLAQPKNKNYGSVLPYFAKASMQGLEASRAPYKQLTQDALMNQKLKDVEYQRGERKYQDDQRILAANEKATRDKILGEGLFETVLTDRPNLTMPPEQLTLPSGEQSVRPMFGTTLQAPTAEQKINYGTIKKLIKSGNLADAGTAFDIGKQFKDLENPKLSSKVVGGKLVFTDDLGNIRSVTKIGDPKVTEKEIIRKTMRADGTVMETPIIKIEVDGKIIGYRDIEGVQTVKENNRGITIKTPTSPKIVTNASSRVTKKLVKNIFPNLNIDLDEAGYVESLANTYIAKQRDAGVTISPVDAVKHIIERENLIQEGNFFFNDSIDINRSSKEKKSIDSF
tara:strand:+ start:129 stop:1298 length:1170 start_codon:yes stop_codon:yes gene_type:complete